MIGEPSKSQIFFNLQRSNLVISIDMTVSRIGSSQSCEISD